MNKTKEIKVGTIQSTSTINNPFRITFISNSNGEPAKDILGNIVKEGDIITPINTIFTNDSRVEIRNEEGIVFRLLENSDFQINNSEVGLRPMINGKVYKYRFTYISDSGVCWKAPMSCWNGCRSTMVYERVSINTDVYYCLGDMMNIYEFDESGKKFNIITLNEGEKCEIVYDNSKSMRERYVVKNLNEISDKEYDYLVNNYINPKHWR